MIITEICILILAFKCINTNPISKLIIYPPIKEFKIIQTANRNIFTIRRKR